MKYIFWDIDGTLLPFHAKALPKSTVQALAALRCARQSGNCSASKISSFRIRWQAQLIRRLSNKFVLILKGAAVLLMPQTF